MIWRKYHLSLSNPKEELYLKLCDEVDNILKRSGIRKKCIECSKEGHGCCSGCKHLTRKGCGTKSLICKLWLCHKDLFVEMDGKDKEKYREIQKTANKEGWDIIPRTDVNYYFGGK